MMLFIDTQSRRSEVKNTDERSARTVEPSEDDFLPPASFKLLDFQSFQHTNFLPLAQTVWSIQTSSAGDRQIDGWMDE